MIQHKKQAFTLVELIVVITILAILGTIAFVSFQGYSRDARNGARTSDSATIRSALAIYSTENSGYPLPDDYEELRYSGAVLWRQGSFGEEVRRKIGKISAEIVDPGLGVEFDYGVLATRLDYQIATAYELVGGRIIPGITTAHAIDSSGFINKVQGSYDSYDVNAKNGNDCSLITVPSLLLSEIPSAGEIVLGDSYYFAYNEGRNLPKNIFDSLDSISTQDPFVVEKVYDKCIANNIEDVDEYIEKLSTSYQQYAQSEVYEDIVFTSDSKSFRSNVVTLLEENQIEISSNLQTLLQAPPPDLNFTDDFSGSNNTVIETHTPASGTWIVQGGNAGSYEIHGNALEKSNNSSATLSPVPSPGISSADYSMNFDVNRFGGGSIYLYLRYEDENNYYGVEISDYGYRLYRVMGGTQTDLQNIAESIVTPINVSFSVNGDNLNLGLNGIEKENFIIGGVDGVGKPVIYLKNANTSIDNYTLTYK